MRAKLLFSLFLVSFSFLCFLNFNFNSIRYPLNQIIKELSTFFITKITSMFRATRLDVNLIPYTKHVGEIL